MNELTHLAISPVAMHCCWPTDYN